jgi:FAD/FMN-containing dehydrogenase
MLGRAYGLGCDSLTQVELVTAAGDVVTCDAERHPDLFWACRGGGGGNFGIVTSLQFRTQPLKNITTVRLEWDWAFAPRVLRSWQKWGPSAPDEAFSICGLRADPSGPAPGVRINIIFLGDAAGLEPLLGDLIGPVGAEPTRAVRTMEGLYAMRTLAGCPTVTIQECHLNLVSEEGTVVRQAHVGKSAFFDTPLSDVAIHAAIHHIERARATPGLRQGSVRFDSLGGAIGRVRPDETAFVHRGALFSCQFLAYWQDNADAATTERCRSWIREFHSAMLAESTGGAYVNYTDPELPGWQRAYYGANYDRLVRVKAAYDPNWLFRLPQGIPVG